VNDFLALFTRAAKLMRGAADDAFSPHGVRVGQNLVLELLWEDDGLAPGELARRLGVSTPTVVKMITRMQQAGLVARRPDERDARVVRVYLTDLGRSLREPILAARRGLADRATAALSDEERRDLEAALAKIITSLERRA
jgi:MarR family transcriptional regulator, organic hydroperoxide resistance regulator